MQFSQYHTFICVYELKFNAHYTLLQQITIVKQLNVWVGWLVDHTPVFLSVINTVAQTACKQSHSITSGFTIREDKPHYLLSEWEKNTRILFGKRVEKSKYYIIKISSGNSLKKTNNSSLSKEFPNVYTMFELCAYVIASLIDSHFFHQNSIEIFRKSLSHWSIQAKLPSSGLFFSNSKHTLTS